MSYPYKNVEMVIGIAKKMSDKNIRFIFAGKVGNDTLRRKYTDEVAGLNNVIVEFRFIKDEEIAQLLEIGDVIIVPYDVESMSNSGTARLAFSYGRTVICPKIPSVESIPDDLIYTYSYSTREEHEGKLIEQINLAYKDYLEDHTCFIKKGQMLKEIMIANNSEEAIMCRYKEIFDN